MTTLYYRPARLDVRAMAMTGFFLLILAYILFTVEIALWLRILLVGGLLAATGLFAIRGYALDDDAIIVRHLLWQRRFPRAELQEATLDPGALVGSIRTLGIGGVFGYIGRFYNRHLGRYLSYVTNGRHAVVLRFPQQTVVISPADHVAFLEALQASGSGASP